MKLRVLIVALVLAACAPGLEPGDNGIINARSPGFGSITIAEQPVLLAGDPANGGANFWNAAAGRPLFARSDSAPQITFQSGGPFITPPEFGSRRVVAYAGIPRHGDRCTVYYDPSYVAAGVAGQHLNARVWAHEIGTCIGLRQDQPCDQNQGVMANCFFWQRVLAGWGPTAADTAQLRAAGYIP